MFLLIVVFTVLVAVSQASGKIIIVTGLWCLTPLLIVTWMYSFPRKAVV